MSTVLIDALLSKLPPHIRGLASGYVSKAVDDPTIQAVSGMITSLAEKDSMPVADFISSGRVIQVLGSLVTGIPAPGPDNVTVEVHKCPKCNHVGYLVSK